MKRFCIWLIAGLIGVTASAQTIKDIYIYHTNDTHSRIEPFPVTYADTMSAGKGGVVRRATFIKEERKAHKSLLLFDVGDFSQGTPFYNFFKGEVEIKVMNEMKYDAGTIGNHEFDFGLDNMARLFKMAEFPIVCANYDFSGTVLEGLVKEYVILERDGLHIGVFGLGPKLEGLVARENYGGVKFEDPLAEAQRVATLLKEEKGCDLVICLSHLGWKGEQYSDIELIENTSHIDLVLGGHSHSYFEKPEYYINLDGKKVPLQQMGKNGIFVGKMVVKMKKD